MTPMKNRFSTTSLLLIGFAGVGLLPAVMAHDPGTSAPAGQVCPEGAYVIGFDAESNIICSQTATQSASSGVESAAVIAATPPAEPAPAASAASPPAAEPAAAVSAATAETAAPAAAAPAPAPAAQSAPTPTGAAPVIEDVDPWSVVYGKAQISITIEGSGFHGGSVVVFQGVSHTPTVNSDGTRLEVTLPTRDLPMGAYPIQVRNGPDQVATRKRGLVVY